MGIVVLDNYPPGNTPARLFPTGPLSLGQVPTRNTPHQTTPDQENYSPEPISTWWEVWMLSIGKVAWISIYTSNIKMYPYLVNTFNKMCHKFWNLFSSGARNSQQIPERLPERRGQIPLQPLQEWCRRHTGRWHGLGQDSTGENLYGLIPFDQWWIQRGAQQTHAHL